jgi:hypothetical protein
MSFELASEVAWRLHVGGRVQSKGEDAMVLPRGGEEEGDPNGTLYALGTGSGGSDCIRDGERWRLAWTVVI